MMKLICCQFDIAWENKPANHDKVRRLLDQARPSRGSLVILPEMFATGFSMNVAVINDSVTHETRDFLSRLAADYGVYVVGGLVETAPDGRGRNECAVFSPAGDELARYCKMHPFTFGGEADHYIAGDSVRTFQWHEFTVAPFICYDLRFPEIFRLAVRQGANLYIVIANWPAPRIHHWTALLQARAIENQAYVAGANRCGADPKLSYPGRSSIIDPRGTILAEAESAEGVIAAEADYQALVSYRQELPFLQDMRDDYTERNN
jgi:predicted amidohydrolase